MKQPNKNKAKKLNVPQEDIDFIKNWYKNRKSILGMDDKPITLPKTSFNYKPKFVEEEFVDPSGRTTYGVFYPADKHIGLSPKHNELPGVVSHEVNHYIQDQFNIPDFIKYISDPIESIEGDNPKTEEYGRAQGAHGNYVLDPSEVHSRLMQFRQKSGFKPDQIITPEIYEKAIEGTDNREFFELDMFDDEQLIDLLNKTVYTGKLNEDEGVQVAKYGGILESNNMKNKKKNSNYPMYEFGTIIDNPYTDLAEHQIAIARATQKAQNNPWAKGLNLVGNMAIQYGTSMMNKGMSQGQGVSKSGFNWGNLLSQGVGAIGSIANSQQTMANGGVMGMVGANVEGDEVIETPSGEIQEMQGPSHENGGIDIFAPTGTEVFSKRLKGPDGETMAKRKIKREKTMNKVSKLLDSNPTDVALRNTYKKTRMSNEIEEAQDMAKMQLAKTLSEMVDTFAYGGKMKHYANGGTLGEDPIYGGIQYAKGYGLNQFQPYLNMYGQTPTTMNPNWADVNNRKAFQKLIGTTPDGVFGSDTLSKAQAYYAANPVQPKQAQTTTNLPTIAEGTPGVTTTNTPWDTDRDQIPNFVDINSRNGMAPAPNTPNTEIGDAGEEASWSKGLGDEFSGITLGDMIGMAGNIYSTFAPMRNTLRNRAGDTPNINAFKDYGKDTLAKLDESKQFQGSVRDQALSNLELDRSGTIRRGRNTARSINTMRALDLAADAQVNQAKAQIYNNFAQTMQSILGAEAGALADRDAKVMSGEQARDLADRQDRDNFYTQLGKDISTKGTGLQKIGYDLNKMKTRGVSTKLISELSDNFDIDSSGNITSKTTGSVTPASEYTKLSAEDKKVFNAANQAGYNISVKNGKLVYTGTDIEYDPKNPNNKYNRRGQ